MNIQIPNLLISDDDRDLRESLGDIFRRRGMDVTLASDGQQTLEILEDQRPHLLLLDLNMPRCSGLDVVKTLKAEEVSLPSILMSAQSDDGWVQEAIDAAVFAIQSKPFSIREIQAIVDRALREHHGLGSCN
jgi:DNA-binding response OmpR family regulator